MSGSHSKCIDWLFMKLVKVNNDYRIEISLQCDFAGYFEWDIRHEDRRTMVQSGKQQLL